ncbi:MAG: hypothetical protein AVDCRST_MAG70-1798 [uncultured Thermomicrobiales bacterium]|uniref:Uncharacterized protein n=1 Tax=uncultured Thermomicrobiales bacterium TaxID=1645740 RepID=A0A6J4UXK6_9BACT|nr:MAG: hypothetical protein AVDCRST_MAG70-1798 [uncultured Thermomicrobiales bacterium]
MNDGKAMLYWRSPARSLGLPTTLCDGEGNGVGHRRCFVRHARYQHVSTLP